MGRYNNQLLGLPPASLEYAEETQRYRPDAAGGDDAFSLRRPAPSAVFSFLTCRQSMISERLAWLAKATFGHGNQIARVFRVTPFARISSD